MLVITIEHPLTTAVGLLGNFLSAMVVLAPMSTVYNIYKKKSTGSFDSTPYVVGLFSAMHWVYYGLLTHDVLLLVINIGVCVIEVMIYLTIYFIYAPNKLRVYTLKLILFFNVGIFGCLVLFTTLFTKGRRRVQIAGGISATFAASVFASPLGIIRLVIRTKSVEYMPFTLSFFLTLSALAWFSYGLLQGDMFVALPNVLGFMFGVTQIIIYLMYMNHKKEDDPNLKLGNLQDIEVMPAATPSSADIELPGKEGQQQQDQVQQRSAV